MRIFLCFTSFPCTCVRNRHDSMYANRAPQIDLNERYQQSLYRTGPGNVRRRVLCSCLQSDEMIMYKRGTSLKERLTILDLRNG